MPDQLKRALHYAYERMLGESLAETLPPEKVWLHVRRDVVERIVKCDEVQLYLKGHKNSNGTDCEVWPEWHGLPRILYGFRTFSPNQKGYQLTTMQFSDHDVQRITPDLYLYFYKEGCPAAWYIPVPYIPE